MFNVLGPHVAEGIRRGDKYVVISSPEVAEQLREWLKSKGVDPENAHKSGQLFSHAGEASQDDMRALVARSPPSDGHHN